jgi:hypothetical protein
MALTGTIACFHCSRVVEFSDRVGFRDQCPGCDRPLHVCCNCTFYDPSYNNSCREPMADRVVDKGRFNFCEYFAPANPTKFGKSNPASLTSDAKGKLEALFKKKS